MEKQLKSKIATWFMLVVLIAQTLTPVASVFAEDTSSSSTQSTEVTSSPQSSLTDTTIPPATETSAPASIQTPPSSAEATTQTSASASQGEETKATEEEAGAEDEEPARESSGEKIEKENSVPSALKELENIFTFDYFKQGDKDVVDGAAIDFTKSYAVQYKWDTKGMDVKAGDTVTLPLPDVFKHWPANTPAKDIVVTGGLKVGTYTISNGQLTFTFNKAIEDSTVQNGYVGFLLEFDEKKFVEQWEQEIDFDGDGKKDLTVVAVPKSIETKLVKTGVPDKEKDAREITWTIEVTNGGNEALSKEVLKDTLPNGVGEPRDFVVKELTFDYNGNKKVGKEVAFKAPVITGNTFEMTFDQVAARSGYQIEYKTSITDFSLTEFTNGATFTNGKNKLLEAEVTVYAKERSNPIEKSGEVGKDKDGNDQITWTISVNKAGLAIKNAIVQDVLPAGLTFVEGSIGVQKWEVKAGNIWNWAEPQPDQTQLTQFPLTLGEIKENEWYQITFKTTIDWSKVNNGQYQKTGNKFSNTATLLDGKSQLGEATADVTINRSSLIRKDGASKVDYENKTLTWTVHVNEARHPLKNVTVTDILPKGLSIKAEDITVNGEKIDPKKVTIKENQDKTTTVTLALGDIGTKYAKIEYQTTITDFTVNEFKNSATLTGDGVGQGDHTTTKPIKPAGNAFSKTVGTVNYTDKTIEWKITVDPKREAIKALTITDTFPNKGLIMLNDSVKVTVGGKEKTKGWTLSPNGNGYHQGFVLAFDNEILPLNQLMTITYKTSFDPQKEVEGNRLEANTSTDRVYKNNAHFVGTTVNDNKIDTNAPAETKLRVDAWNSGKKDGQLVHEAEGSLKDGWVSGAERKIAWQLYTNYYQQNLGTGVSIEDTLQYEGTYDEESFQVLVYKVNANGTTEITKTALAKDKYTVKVDGKKFTLTFKEAVSERYVVTFTTTVPDISQEKYTNEAVLKVGDKQYPYSGTVNYAQWNQYLDKKAVGQSGNTVFIGEELTWQVTANQNLSVIKEASITDTISAGLTYVQDSLTIVSTDNVKFIKGQDYEEKATVNEDGTTSLVITFTKALKQAIQLSYKTVVVAENGQKVNNKVALKGIGVENKSKETTQLTAKEFSWVGGELNPNLGAIHLKKVDALTQKVITTGEATFELWFKLNGKDVQFGSDFTTKKGELSIGNLPLRTYYLKEKAAPNGYFLSEEVLTVEVDKTVNNNKENIVEVTFENIAKVKISVNKIWDDQNNQDGIRPESIVVQLLADKVLTEEKVTLSESNKWKASFDNLPAMNRQTGKKIKYQVQEVKTAEGYEASVKEAPENTFTLTNTHEVEVIKVSGKKTWVDKNENTRPDKITVRLFANEKEVQAKEVKKSDDWKFVFANLPKFKAGKEVVYTITEDSVAGYNTEISQKDFTITNTRKSYAIGDYTWIDANNNGLQDQGEEILAGVKVELYDATGKNLLQTTTTNAQGFYLFDELEAGDYKVKFTLTKEQAQKYEFTKQTVGENAAIDSDANPKDGFTKEIQLNDKNAFLTKDYKGVKATQGIDPTWDAGVVLKATPIVPAKTRVSVEKVWVGKAQTAVTVHLFADGKKVDSIELSKENNWKHTFKDLPVVHATTDKQAIVYTVEEDQVSGYNTAITGDAKGGFTITNTRKSYAIGDYTWIDANNNGLQDRGEKVLAGVKVELYDATGKNVLQTTTTNERGFYLFDELEAGKYTVKFILTKDQAKLYEFTKANVGQDDAIDSDANPKTGFTQVITLDDSNKALTKDYRGVKATQGIDPTWDAGVVLKATPIVPAKTHVSVEKVWVGKAQKAVTVHLFADGKKVDSIELSKENNWKHTFKDLPVAHATTDKQAIVYTVKEEQVVGYNTVITGDAKSGFVITNTRKSYAIGDYTWIDANNNGLQDQGEEVLAGVKVELFDQAGQLVATTTTNNQGFYLFDELEAGDYKVKFTLTKEQAQKYEFTKQNAGENTNLDSDADVNGWTVAIHLNEKNSSLTKDYAEQAVKATEGIDPTWDAGVILRDLPENPGEPEKPSKPENPAKPEKPSKPENPGEPGKPSKPENPAKPNKPNGLLPQTGDDSNPIFISLVGLVIFSLAGTMIVKRRRKSE